MVVAFPLVGFFPFFILIEFASCFFPYWYFLDPFNPPFAMEYIYIYIYIYILCHIEDMYFQEQSEEIVVAKSLVGVQPLCWLFKGCNISSIEVCSFFFSPFSCGISFIYSSISQFSFLLHIGNLTHQETQRLKQSTS
jgi:hypothetical protein